MSNPLLKFISTNRQDAVLYKAETLYKAAGDDAYEQSEALNGISEMLACLDGYQQHLYDHYIARISKTLTVKPATLTANIKRLKDKETSNKHEQFLRKDENALPKWVNRDRWESAGFDFKVDTNYPQNTGMYFRMGGNKMEQLTNFVITPIVQIKSFIDEDKRRITEIFNGKTKHVFELPSKAFISPELFESTLMDEGYYICYDGFAKSHINRIKSYFVGQFPEGSELKKLGWQAEGFFAFSNVIYKNRLINFDEYGLAKVDDKIYLSMGASNILANIRADEDLYKNDKVLKYVESPISYREWAQRMCEVWEEKGMIAIAWTMLAANRDIVMARNSYCPLPYCYGPPGSGKSKFMDSCVSFFAMNLKPFNLNQGTEFSFWEYMERFRNILAPYNEFDVQSIDEKRSRAFKGAADGEGRTKGAGKRNKTTTQEINSTPLLGGQYLANMDGSSILSRATPVKFTLVTDRTEEKKKAFDELKDLEKKGITSLCTLLFEQRQFIEDSYQECYDEIAKKMNREFKEEGHSPSDRSRENYTTLLALVKLYGTKLELPFTYDEFYAYCKDQIVRLNTMVGESNNLGEFWKIIEFLSNQEKGLEPGWEFKVETHTEVKSLIADKDSKTSRTFDKPTRILFLRFNQCYSAFSKEYGLQKRKAAISDSTIKTYLMDQPYYIGAQSNGNFKSKRQNIKTGTSSMVIDYDLLIAANDISLERIENEDVREYVELEGRIAGRNAGLEEVLNTQKIVFYISQDASYLNEQSMTVNKQVDTKCFDVQPEHYALIPKLIIGAMVRVAGMLSIQNWGDRQSRTLEIQKLEIISLPPGYQDPPPPRFMPTPPPADPQYTIDHSKPDTNTF